jgi:signal transduction histidine kinase/DNA-binding response OmpR family regulator
MVDYSNSGKDFEMPVAIKEKWQRMVNIMSNLLRVPTGFIMKVNGPHIQIFTTNVADTNPYHAGQNFELDGLYCEEVMKSDNLLLVPDALKDPEWDNNPEIPAGFIYYLGYPIHWPTGKMFGTICVQDYENNLHATDNKDLLEEFRSVCELDLLMVQRRYEREKLMAELEQEIVIRKKAEDELKRSQKAAEAANRAKSIFLANMSHELRAPLNTILGFSQMMGRDPDATAEQQEKITIINRSGGHLLGMINNVLDLSKIEAGRVELVPESFDLPQMLQDIGSMFEVCTESAGLRFDLQLDPSLAQYVKSDIGKLRQILTNLLDNAMKITSEGGISLRARAEPIAGDSAMVSLQLEVEDSGPGIPPDQLESIFEPFVQAGHVRTGPQGTGLGLSICKAFVELMGGEISVESWLGKGSLFHVGLPLALAKSTDAEDIKEVKPAVLGLEPGQSAWRILVVEDNAENRLLLNSLLLQVGFDTRQAENGEEAVTLFKQWQPHFIWMDMRMPVMDGYQATALIRSLPGGDTVKIVAITASAFKEQRESILEAGCDEVVHKPFQAHEIFETMREQLGVHYVYEEEADKPPSSAEGVIDIALAKEMAASLPEQLFDELEQAAMALDMEETYEVLERIAEIQPELAGMLRMRVEEMDFSTIRRVLNHE